MLNDNSSDVHLDECEFCFLNTLFWEATSIAIISYCTMQVILLPDIHSSIKVNGIPHTLSLQWCLLTNCASNMAPNVIARIHNRLSQNP